nr:MAG: replication associated protein [Cressdnaviricota sp.]
MSSSSNPQKRYCFTLNNYGTNEFDEICERLRVSSSYFIVGKEIGDSGTPHLQGYFCLKTRARLLRVKEIVSSRAHIEPARGNAVDNRTYCSKDGDYCEEGTIPNNRGTGEPSDRPAKKSRDELAREFGLSLGRGRSGMVQFADDNPGCYAFSGHTMLRNHLGLRGAIERPNITVTWLYGKPGVGKSMRAHREYESAYIKDPRTKWWNGYLLETHVIIDDFGPNGIDINHLLRWFDRYKCYVEVKGDMVPLLAEYFIVTSNFHPKDVFTDNIGATHAQYPALERRIKIEEIM